jgi:hypothetical protein
MDDPSLTGDARWITYKSGNGAGYQNDYYVTESAAGRSYVTTAATWTLSNGHGLVQIRAYIPSLDAVAGVVYRVYDGGTLVGSVAVNQKNYTGFVTLGTWQFSSGTVVVKVNDNEGSGPYGWLIGLDCVEVVPVG